MSDSDDGAFPQLSTVCGKTWLYVDSSRIRESVEYYQRHKLDWLAVNPMRGYSLANLDFLEEYPSIEDLEFGSPASGSFDLRPLQFLRNLRSLSTCDPLLLPVSLNQFPRLKFLRGVWHPQLGLDACPGLRELDLSGYRPKSRDLRGLQHLRELRVLRLTQPNIVSLAGIQALQNLEFIDIAYATKLQDLAPTQLPQTVEQLHFEVCRKLQAVSELSALKHLRVLRLNGCAAIPSLAFLNDMPSLEEFRFVQTLIEDGDLSPLLRLKSVGFFKNARYSHTPKQIDDAIRANKREA